jgi:hypothetical protein
MNNVSSATYIKRTIKNKSQLKEENIFEIDKLENYFLKVKLHTDLIDKEYRKYKEKYFKYKSNHKYYALLFPRLFLLLYKKS